MTDLHRTTPSPLIRHVHLGLGNFFRAHQAWYSAHAPDASKWGIAAFTGRATDRSRALALGLTAQEGLYTLVVRGPVEDAFEVIDSVCSVHVVDDHEAWLGYLSDPDVQIVTTTVTEAGYVRRPDGSLDAEDPAVAADVQVLREDITAHVVTAPAKLAAGLAARRRADAGPLTVVPCDNLPSNGLAVSQVVNDLAELIDADLVSWIAANVSFATTMVDRITPEATDEDKATVESATGIHDRSSVVTEPFSEWVISGEFAGDRPRWDLAGATFADDVTPFEERKLWLLNGAHSMLAYAGSTRGHVTVADAMRDDVCRTWIEEWWAAVSSYLTLPTASNDAYRTALMDRFANPRMRHRLDQIAWDGSQKLPIRTLPTLRKERERGRLPLGATRTLAGWVCHLRGSGAAITDARADEFVPLAQGPLPEAIRRVLGALDPTLSQDEAVLDAVLTQCHELGQL